MSYIFGVAPLEVEVEPDPIAQLDPVDDRPGRVAGGGGEGVPLDGPQAESATLVEAQVADVGRGGGHDHGRRLPTPGGVHGGVDERPADPASAMAPVDGHVVDLAPVAVGDQLQM